MAERKLARQEAEIAEAALGIDHWRIVKLWEVQRRKVAEEMGGSVADTMPVVGCTAGDKMNRSNCSGELQMAFQIVDIQEMLPAGNELIAYNTKFWRKLTKPLGLWPRPGLCGPFPAPSGVLSPLPSPVDCSAAFLALCSAKRFLRSEAASNFGFFTPLPPTPPGPGFPVAARRSASA